MLKGKKILLGITGSIAAYKAAMLVRLLVRGGAEVQVVMTPLAKQFITPLTLATLSKRPVLVEFFDPEDGRWNNHVDLGEWADAYIIAPATANTIAKMVTGIADNLLLTAYLSARCPVFLAPAMDLDMFGHVTTRQNLRELDGRGHTIIEPATGELASGLEGKGRMEEPQMIYEIIDQFFAGNTGEKKKPAKPLTGKQILVTAGPTHESIDPVRFIGNHSTGKMGYAIAKALIQSGAKVILISGPVHLDAPQGITKFIQVTSAAEMYDAALQEFPALDGAIMSAAVADYRPETAGKSKMKSSQETMDLHLIKNPDIAEELGKIKKADQFLAGFALETDNELEHARAKLQKKNFDLIVLNSLRDHGAGFGTDTNKITILDRDNKIYNFGLKSKSEAADDIISLIAEKISRL